MAKNDSNGNTEATSSESASGGLEGIGLEQIPGQIDAYIQELNNIESLLTSPVGILDGMSEEEQVCALNVIFNISNSILGKVTGLPARDRVFRVAGLSSLLDKVIAKRDLVVRRILELQGLINRLMEENLKIIKRKNQQSSEEQKSKEVLQEIYNKPILYDLAQQYNSFSLGVLIKGSFLKYLFDYMSQPGFPIPYHVYQFVNTALNQLSNELPHILDELELSAKKMLQDMEQGQFSATGKSFLKNIRRFGEFTLLADHCKNVAQRFIEMPNAPIYETIMKFINEKKEYDTKYFSLMDNVYKTLGLAGFDTIIEQHVERCGYKFDMNALKGVSSKDELLVMNSRLSAAIGATQGFMKYIKVMIDKTPLSNSEHQQGFSKIQAKLEKCLISLLGLHRQCLLNIDGISKYELSHLSLSDKLSSILPEKARKRKSRDRDSWHS